MNSASSALCAPALTSAKVYPGAALSAAVTATVSTVGASTFTSTAISRFFCKSISTAASSAASGTPACVAITTFTVPMPRARPTAFAAATPG